jgi:AcrR family transcriptional regulator
VNRIHIVKRKRRSYHHGNLRPALIEASLTVIAELGVEQFTLRDVARRVGVAPSAVYRHFADKEELLTSVAAECAQRLGKAMDDAAAASSDWAERFRNSGIAYVRFAVEHPAHFRVLNLPTLADRLPLRAGVDEWMQSELAALQRARADGELADLPIEHIMLAARSLTYGLSRLIVDAQDGLGNLSVEGAVVLAEAITHVLGVGLLPRRAGVR